MTPKSFLIVGALALGSLGIASAKSYDFSIGSTAQMGQNTLKPGDYTVKLNGTEAVIVNVQSNKSFAVQVKVEHTGQKSEQTAVESRSKDGVDNIYKIDLGGSDTVLNLGE